jgi:hypothetical protein
MRAGRSANPWVVRLAWMIIAAGILLRLAHLVAGRNLWSDELMLANEVLPRGLTELTQPFEATGAPIGFLMLTRLAVDLLGEQDWVLRLVPFIAGCAALVIVYRVALRLLTPSGALVAVAILAVSEPAIYYATEFKQYAGDLAVLPAVLLAALRVQEAPESRARLFEFALVATAAIWLSHPAVFAVAAAGLTLFTSALWDGRHRSAAALGIIGAFCVGNFVVTYLLSLNALLANDHLREYWAASFMPLSPVAALRWQATTLYKVLETAAGVRIAAVALLAAMLGTLDLARRNPSALGFLLLPIAFGMAASSLHSFPFAGRHTLFVASSVALLTAAGIDVLARAPRPMPRVAGILLAALVLLPQSFRSVQAALAPPGREEIEAVLHHVATRWRPGDALYLYYHALRGFTRYRDRAGLPPDLTPIIGVRSRDDWRRYETDVQQLDGRERMWVVFSHVHVDGEDDEEQAIVAALDRLGRCLDELHVAGASAYLYDLR